MVHRHTASECLREPLVHTLPTKCQQLKRGYGECRRGMIDMRKRFRGNQPANFRHLQQAEKSGENYMLYAGKSAFGGAAHETDGNENAPKDWRELENEKYRLSLKKEEKS